MPLAPPPPPLRPFARPALAAALGAGLGIVAAARVPALPFEAWLGGLLAAGVGALVAARPRRRLVTLRGAALAGATAFGLFAFGGLRMAAWQSRPPDHLAHAVQAAERAEVRGEDATLTLWGHVAEPPSPLPYGTRLVVAADSALRGAVVAPLRGRVQITLARSRFRRDSAAAPVIFPAFEQGDRIEVTGELRSLPGRRNPADFDYGAFLRRRGIHATLAVYDAEAVAFLGPTAHPLTQTVNAARAHVRRALDRYVRSEDTRHVLAALLLADRSGIAPETRDAFAQTGLLHLLAVSGLHVLLVGMLLYGLLKPVLGRFGLSWQAVEWSRAIVTLALLGLYVGVTGGTVSVQRAFIMAAVWIVGALLQRPSDTLNTLGLAALVILVLRPAALFDVGFQLSFAAVGAIVTLVPLFEQSIPERWRRGRLARWTLDMTLVSLAATLGTAPVVLYHFGRLPLAGLALNLAAIPATAATLFGGLGCVLLAGGFPLGADAFAAIAELSSAALLWISQAGADRLGWTLLEGYVRDPALVTALAAALLALALFRRPRVRWALLATALGFCTLSLWGSVLRGDLRPHLDVVFLDVGQGDATLIRTPNGRHLLVDAGLRSPYTDQGARTILPHLDRFGIRRLDVLVLTHPDADHAGGALSTLAGVSVGRLIHNGQETDRSYWNAAQHLADSLGIAQQTVQAGDTLALDPAVRIRVLHPPAPPAPWADGNDGSVVLRIEYGETSFLLTADAEAGAEAALADRYGEALASTVVKVGHHGSRTSSTPAFVAAASDSTTAFAVVSVARRNRYGLPDEEPLARWHTAAAEVLQTAQEGAVWLRSDGERVERVAWR